MIALSCNNLTKSYIVDKILDDISFSINEGEKAGLVGLNGAGKSTLFNILSGEISPDSGSISYPKNYSIALLKQQLFTSETNSIYEELLGVFENLSKMENELRSLEVQISEESQQAGSSLLDELMNRYSNLTELFQENNGYGYKSEVKGVLRGLGFSEADFEKKLYELSGGQKARVSLGKILLENPEILLLDEPTNHLDIEAIDWLEKYIKDYKGTIILISHDRYFLDNTVGKILHLENGGLQVYNGNYTEFIKKRKANLDALRRQYESQQKEIARQEAIIKKFEQVKRADVVKLVKSRQKMLDKMKKMDEPSGENKKTHMRFDPQVQSGNDVLKLRDLSIGYNEQPIFEDINLDVYKGDHIGIIGPNGIGKTSLFKSIQGIIPAIAGEVTVGHNVNIGYFDQEQTNLNMANTVLDEIWDDYPNLTHTEIRSLLAQFLFMGDDIYKEVSSLSGGEKSRLSLLKLMLSKSNLLLMDEPTNHLDIDSKEILEDALSKYTGTVLVISHDRYFLNKVSDKILEMNLDGVTEFLGNYDYYLEKKAKEKMQGDEDTSEATKTELKALKKKEKERQKATSKERRKVKDLESAISECENKISELEQQLCEPEVYSDHEKSLSINEDLTNVKKLLDSYYEKWIELTDGDI